MSDEVVVHEPPSYVAQIVWQNWAHHIGVPWEERIGEWCVFRAGTVPYGWPGEGIRLAIELTTEELAELRKSTPAVVSPITPAPLPSPTLPPAPIAPPEEGELQEGELN
jgi:hypothetical protein